MLSNVCSSDGGFGVLSMGWDEKHELEEKQNEWTVVNRYMKASTKPQTSQSYKTTTRPIP